MRDCKPVLTLNDDKRVHRLVCGLFSAAVLAGLVCFVLIRIQ